MRLWLTVVLALLGVVTAHVVRPLQTLKRRGGEASRRPQDTSDGDLGVLIHTVHPNPRRYEALVAALTSEDAWQFPKPIRASQTRCSDGESATRQHNGPARSPGNAGCLERSATPWGRLEKRVNTCPVAWNRNVRIESGEHPVIALRAEPYIFRRSEPPLLGVAQILIGS